MGLQITFGLSLTVSVCPVFKVISVPFPFRRMNAIAPKSISNSDCATSRDCFRVAHVWLRPLEATIQFRNVAPISGTIGTGMRSGPCSRWGPQSGSYLIIALGGEGLYLSIFRYRSITQSLARRPSSLSYQRDGGTNCPV